jgi:hypothetical protein
MNVTYDVNGRGKQDNIVLSRKDFHEFEQKVNDAFLGNWAPDIAGNPLAHA